LFLFLAAHQRSEATMRFNNFGNTIFGINITGQGISNVVEGTHVVVLRHLVSKIVRRLSSRLAALRLASWRALTCMPAAMTSASMTPAMATCPKYLDRWQKRSGVVETRGTVGVC
jgi:hypothetical protein